MVNQSVNWTSILQVQLKKGSLIGRFTGLSDGAHVMTITVKQEHKHRGSERSKISLDYFKVLPGQGTTIEKIDDREPSHSIWISIQRLERY